MTFRQSFKIVLVAMTLMWAMLLPVLLFASPTEMFAGVDTPPEQLEEAWSGLIRPWGITMAILAGLCALAFKPWKKQ